MLIAPGRKQNHGAFLKKTVGYDKHRAPTARLRYEDYRPLCDQAALSSN